MVNRLQCLTEEIVAAFVASLLAEVDAPQQQITGPLALQARFLRNLKATDDIFRRSLIGFDVIGDPLAQRPQQQLRVLRGTGRQSPKQVVRDGQPLLILPGVNHRPGLGAQKQPFRPRQRPSLLRRQLAAQPLQLLLQPLYLVLHRLPCPRQGCGRVHRRQRRNIAALPRSPVKSLDLAAKGLQSVSSRPVMGRHPRKPGRIPLPQGFPQTLRDFHVQGLTLKIGLSLIQRLPHMGMKKFQIALSVHKPLSNEGVLLQFHGEGVKLRRLIAGDLGEQAAGGLVLKQGQDVGKVQRLGT
ncbi:hypothetical protein SDC9_83595 [bioreactor metagenome]|uniref:Uncharacterized protein n=1 Tax=bioreactor metagenome TaxID=1076179 RepID=A0A644ZAS7_9ZZZZ